MNYFLVGIKGTGMSALAMLLKDLGNNVVGSDENKEYFTDLLLKEKSIKWHPFGSNLNNDYIYIISNAYDQTNIDVKSIIDNKFEYYYYHDFIGKKLKKDIIAISGTHGKTTTSTFLKEMLNNKTSFIIGDGSGGGTNKSNLLVLEACEYRDHFLSYKPNILVINNIEMDHPDYFKDINQMLNSYQRLVNQSDLVVVNYDDPNVKKLKFKAVLKVGTQKDADVKYHILDETKDKTKVQIIIGKTSYEISVPFVGKHLVYDYVMAYIICILLGEKPNVTNINLPHRRIEEYQYGNTILVDDYAHHPTEIKALIETLKKKYPDYKINAVFQPHTYSRTLTLKKEFKEAFDLFDSIYLAKVFTSKRESENVYQQLKINKIFKNYRSFTPKILDLIDKKKFELWIFLGAGTISKYIKELIKNENE
ncbi:MAG: Mur ligase family protein [Bacilli bacterium]|nr:Mur ligase family protein [Bacilli bacterium]MDD7314915.1 Mur ligase family protein [Bacilli bacterium]MDY4052083.1 Mur ligase family protein [Bacilli bacterium]